MKKTDTQTQIAALEREIDNLTEKLAIKRKLQALQAQVERLKAELAKPDADAPVRDWFRPYCSHNFCSCWQCKPWTSFVVTNATLNGNARTISNGSDLSALGYSGVTCTQVDFKACTPTAPMKPITVPGD